MMHDIRENMTQNRSMPVHNPFYKNVPVSFRANIIKAECIAARPDAVERIVPAPLIYRDTKIFIVFLDVTELKEGFSEDDAVWNEIAVQIPVFHNDEPGLYVCENYCSDIRSILSGRETYGYPKVPCRIDVERSGHEVTAKLLKYGSVSEILHFTSAVMGEPPSLSGPPPGGPVKGMPKIILFKFIPSPAGNRPDVQQLVAMKYNKPVIHSIRPGRGNVEIMQGAPDYLKEAGIKETAGVTCLDMETNVIGGEVIHNYNA